MIAPLDGSEGIVLYLIQSVPPVTVKVVYVCTASLHNHVVVDAPGHIITYDPLPIYQGALAPLIGLSTRLAAR